MTDNWGDPDCLECKHYHQTLNGCLCEDLFDHYRCFEKKEENNND